MNAYIYGYARVSTQQQDLIQQRNMLQKYNCTEIFTEKISGMQNHRPGLTRLKDKIRPGDTLVGLTIHVHQLKTFYYPQVQKNVILS